MIKNGGDADCSYNYCSNLQVLLAASPASKAAIAIWGELGDAM